MTAVPSARGATVLVAGGGFGGLYAATYLARSELARDGARIVLVDRTNYFTFTPLLAEVAAGTLLPTHVTYPYRVLARKYGFEFYRDRVRGLEPDRKLLRTERAELGYDSLVLALGATPRSFGKREIASRSVSFTSVDDATYLRNRAIDAFERAALSSDPEERARLTPFVVAGAGPAGVELASELHALLDRVLPPYYDDPPRGRVVLAEGSDRILAGLDDELARRGLHRLRDRGIEVCLETRVTGFDGRCVSLVGDDGEQRIVSETLVWTAGTSPPSWVADLPLPTERGALQVEPSLQVRGMEGVFAVGDLIRMEDPRSGRPYPPVAPIAISQGVRAAGNVENRHMGRPLEPYHARHAGKIVSLGGGVALVDLLGFRITGWVAWWIYRLAYLLKLVGLENKIRVLLTLVLNTFFEADISSRGEPDDASS